MNEYEDELALFRANADQIKMLWTDVMPVIKSVYDSSIAVGFSDAQATEFCKAYFIKLLGSN